MKHFSLIRQLVAADLITLFGSSSGIASIFCCITSVQSQSETWLHYATFFSCLSLLCDFLDGKVARRYGKSGLGQDLDSLADIISFGVAPAVYGFCFGLDLPLDILILVLFVKLARFNTTAKSSTTKTRKKEQVVDFFEGVPIPSTVFISIFLSLSLYKGWISRNPLLLHSFFGWNYHPVVGLYAVSGMLQMSKTLKIRKL